MNSPPTREQFDKAFSKSHDLDPAPDSWGMFAYSDAPPNICGSGLGSFQWFPAKAEMLHFVRDYMSWWNPAPSSMTPEEIAEQVQSIVEAGSDALAKLRDDLNESMRNMWHIEWWGQFKELCESADEFPLKVRASFHEDCELPESSSIRVDDVAAFKEYLREYGV
jgi:hypothetical protein